MEFGIFCGRLGLDVDDHIHEVGEPLHQQILDDVRRGVSRLEGRPPVEPYMQVHEHIIRWTARLDLMVAHHLRH